MSGPSKPPFLVNRTVARQVDGCHEHGRSGSQAAVQHPHARSHQDARDGILDALRRNAGIVPNSDGQSGRFFFNHLGQPQDKSRRHFFNGFVGQVDLLSRNPLAGHSADIRATLKLFPIGIQHCSFSFNLLKILGLLNFREIS